MLSKYFFGSFIHEGNISGGIDGSNKEQEQDF